MFKKVLIANRGEIAVRVIRACKEWGIGLLLFILMLTLTDACSLADESVCIGSHEPRNSYLNIPAIMSAVDVQEPKLFIQVMVFYLKIINLLK